MSLCFFTHLVPFSHIAIFRSVKGLSTCRAYAFLENPSEIKHVLIL